MDLMHFRKSSGTWLLNEMKRLHGLKAIPSVGRIKGVERIVENENTICVHYSHRKLRSIMDRRKNNHPSTLITKTAVLALVYRY